MTTNKSERHYPSQPGTAISRRSLITAASLSVPLAAFGASSAFAAKDPSTRPIRKAPATAATVASTYAHPGLAHTLSDIEHVSAKVAAGINPWTGGWNRLVANGRSSAGWQPRPLATVIRGGTGENYVQMYLDIHAAHQNALRWHISGDPAHGAAAVRILNAWSGMLTTVTGNADRYLAAGIYGYQWANAGELMRDHPDFAFERSANAAHDLLPHERGFPHEPQQRGHHQLLGQLGPLQHGLDHGHRHLR
ncbi:hypothetical protein [Arthrobacter sp. ISL-30]|uniref:hypothetical protein n=1 Tax=Arthrobacter sp. ISL-30 TaxID=2819109 RepID=UPI002034F80B|nr:hypothetical protein [Arthrobacter sp. ISL-30]